MGYLSDIFFNFFAYSTASSKSCILQGPDTAIIRLSFPISILFAVFNRLFEFLFYAGILGAIQALLTPQINNFDGSNYEYLEYYISHTGILILPIYMFKNLHYALTKFSWLKVVVYLNILLLIVMPLNYVLDSNYMYLASKPHVSNPLVIGEWPYYIIFWEIIVVAFTYILYIISTRKML